MSARSGETKRTLDAEKKMQDVAKLYTRSEPTANCIKVGNLSQTDLAQFIRYELGLSLDASPLGHWTVPWEPTKDACEPGVKPSLRTAGLVLPRNWGGHLEAPWPRR